MWCSIDRIGWSGDDPTDQPLPAERREELILAAMADYPPSPSNYSLWLDYYAVADAAAERLGAPRVGRGHPDHCKRPADGLPVPD